MPKLPLSIIDFVNELKLLKAGGLSVAQQAVLKATYGEALDPAEMEIYCRATGRETYAPREHSELTVIAGRQSGKTSRIGAIIALYEAFREHGLPRGQRAYVLVIAPVVQQAAIAFDFMKRYILGSPILEPRVRKIRNDEIELRNEVIIACRPCSYIAVRGVPIICAICDEIAFWRHEDTAANPEQEVIDAIRPAMATLYNTKIVKISTPFRKDGILWREFQKRTELRHLVWQLSTEEMNPAVSKQFLEDARQDNEQTFRREHLAEFTDNVLGWITPEILEPCVLRGVRELPRVSSGTYVAAVDPAFRSSNFGFAVVHRSDAGAITVVHAHRWSTKTVPPNLDLIAAQVSEVLRRYDLDTLVGDQYCFPVLQQCFAKLGIQYREFAFTQHTRGSLYGNLRLLMTEEKIQFVDQPELLQELLDLEEVKAPNGAIDIRPPRSGKDDIAISVALAASQLSNMEIPRTLFMLGEVERGPRLCERCIPGSCPLEAICANFPECLDAGFCLGFKDLRPSLVSIQG
jgi:hypothetical protein